MSKLYRFEVETIWVHPEINFAKRRKMVYDFIENDLIMDERSHADGQDFYDPQHSPHIYAPWDKAEATYSDLDWKLEDWKPLAFLQGSTERIEAFRLISVDENGNEEVEAENNLLADLIAVNEAYRQIQTA